MLFRSDPDAPLLSLPLFLEGARCGFPSPAQDYVENRLDLNQLCVAHPAATYFVRAEGDSMQEAGIFDQDILVVDRSLSPGHGDIIVASLDGEFTVKTLLLQPRLQLLPANPAYPAIIPAPEQQLEVFGVVTFVIRNLRAVHGHRPG